MVNWSYIRYYVNEHMFNYIYLFQMTGRTTENVDPASYMERAY